MMKIVWHYTYSAHIREILESRVLLPPRMCPHFSDRLSFYDPAVRDHLQSGAHAAHGFNADSKMLLFSQREDWEPASFRGIYRKSTGDSFDAHSLEDYEEYGVHVYRIGVDRSLLMPWKALTRAAGMHKDQVKTLEKIARNFGGSHCDWWGTLKPLAIEHWKALQTYDAATKTWKDGYQSRDRKDVCVR
jgi:hypothetical protein